MAATFTARYPSRCAHCPDGIEPGELCTWDGDAAVHVDCDAAAPEAAPAEVCDSCWTAKSVTGACAC